VKAEGGEGEGWVRGECSDSWVFIFCGYSG
jgi:hypothetical protein